MVPTSLGLDIVVIWLCYIQLYLQKGGIKISTMTSIFGI